MGSTFPVLIIDDNEAICTALQVLFDLNEVPTLVAHTPEEGLDLARRHPLGAILQDMNFTEESTTGEEGIRLFRALRQIDSQVPILLITAWTTLETAVKLVKEGAQDYLSKPWNDDKLLEQVVQLRQMRIQQNLTGPDLKKFNTQGLVYADPATARVVNTALRVAAADVPVLITGPNGSGKEMLAHLIQANSPRSGKPFLTVNAGGLPNELLESELFGNEPGAFTGARNRRIGRFEEADGGTLFLDEIGNLSIEGQMKLLRVLQSGEFSRLGSNRVIRSDVRVISATNADLLQAITQGKFREDLYFRLNVVELSMPPLAERPGDILPLAHHFLRQLSGQHKLLPETEKALRTHSWPGNVRELKNCLQRALLISDSREIGPHDLVLSATQWVQDTPAPEPPTSGEGLAVQKALMEQGGNVSKAAEALGISRQALYRRMEKYGIVWEKLPRR